MDSLIFEPGINAWRTAKATHASVIVDYGNYYRDLVESICKAKHSIFIVGWDIDSRIELIRGEDCKKRPCPNTFYELIEWKLQQEPGIQIYLNKWDFSIFFAKQREPFAGLRWRKLIKKYPNLHYCIDDMLPLGACHHQKIAVIDDEVAYSGGMDIALARWDFRSHHPVNPNRHDPGGFLEPEKHIHFGPYHDIMIVTAGPIVRSTAEWVRRRWKLACKCDCIPMREIPETEALPNVWPDSDGSDFQNVDCGIAMTVPPMRGEPALEQIEKMYLDEISKAEEFIYIENQFLTLESVAYALNKQLRQKPKLRVLAISCDKPQGIMERKSMWTPRVRFREIIESGGVQDRVALCHPAARENGVEKPVRIHSKLMIVDDKFLHIGSANLNNRSMGMDTEYDIVIQGVEEKARTKIAAVRTDLIREHSGREAFDIDRLVSEGAPIQAFVENVPTSREHFVRLNDEVYRNEKFWKLALWASDPRRPFIPADVTMPFSHRFFRKRASEPHVIALFALFVLAAIVFFWKGHDFSSLDQIENTLQGIKDSSYAFPATIGLFILASLAFFPLSLLIGGTAVVFGAVKGLVISFIGAAIAAGLGYWLGHKFNRASLEKLAGSKLDKIARLIHANGIAAVASIRMLPIAPFGIINLMFGLSRIDFKHYITGTIIGLLPGLLALSFFGASFGTLLQHPTAENITYLILAGIAWVTIVFGANFLTRHRQVI